MNNQHNRRLFISNLWLSLACIGPAISQPNPASPSVSYSKNQTTIGGVRANTFSIDNWNRAATSKLIADAIDTDRTKADCSDAKNSTFDAQLDPQYELLAKETYLYFVSNGQFRPSIEMLLDKQGYAIDRIFDDPDTSLQALGLRSKDGSKPPVLGFPGSDDLRDAAGPKGVGFSKFSPNKQVIKNWLMTITNDRQVNPQGLKPDITGVSLGGALTQRTASEFPTLIGSAISFQSNGIDRETVGKFIQNGGNPNQVRHYIVDGDWRSLVGEVFISGKVVVSTFDASEAGRTNYFQRKHVSGILADFQPFRSLIPENIDPSVTQLLSLTDKPANQTLSEISVDTLNQPDFTFQGKDREVGLEKVRANNPSFVVDRQHVEELRRSGIEAFSKILQDLL